MDKTCKKQNRKKMKKVEKIWTGPELFSLFLCVFEGGGRTLVRSKTKKKKVQSGKILQDATEVDQSVLRWFVVTLRYSEIPSIGQWEKLQETATD